jgi:hypothetical protein
VSVFDPSAEKFSIWRAPVTVVQPTTVAQAVPAGQ